MSNKNRQHQRQKHSSQRTKKGGSSRRDVSSAKPYPHQTRTQMSHPSQETKIALPQLHASSTLLTRPILHQSYSFKVWRNTLILTGIWTSCFLLVALLGLDLFHRLPSPLSGLPNNLTATVQALAAIFGAFSFTVSINMKEVRRFLSIIVALIVVITLILVDLSLPPSAMGELDSPPSIPVHVTKVWNSPFCDQASGWIVSKPTQAGTAWSCIHKELQIWQEQHDPHQNTYAEMDLPSLNGQSYNQEVFNYSATLDFQNPADGDTRAGLVLQTPSNSPGGFVFSVNADGSCHLQRFGNTRFPTELPCAPVHLFQSSVVISVTVSNHILYGTINGIPVVNVFDPLKTGIVGLIVQLQGVSNPSSRVHFSQVKLNTK